MEVLHQSVHLAVDVAGEAITGCVDLWFLLPRPLFLQLNSTCIEAIV